MLSVIKRMSANCAKECLSHIQCQRRVSSHLQERERFINHVIRGQQRFGIAIAAMACRMMIVVVGHCGGIRMHRYRRRS